MYKNLKIVIDDATEEVNQIINMLIKEEPHERANIEQIYDIVKDWDLSVDEGTIEYEAGARLST